jgi:hypothetical protein
MDKENLFCGNDQCIGVFVHLPFYLTDGIGRIIMTLAYSCH